MSNDIHAALNPDINNTRSRERPLSDKEKMQRAKAVCSAAGDPTVDFKGTQLSCTGDIFVGIFFDGTGNNEDEDYKGPPKRRVREQKHSNVVRLYHAFPDNLKVGTTGYYRYYIPGVGTPFDKIGDDGKGFIIGSVSQKAGSAAAWNGEPRIIWGLTRVFNAVSQFVGDRDVINDRDAAGLAELLSGVGMPGLVRRQALKNVWMNRLKGELAARPTPKVTQINLSVYGFSRGAAEARAFVNWLYELCELKDGGWQFAGIPLRVQFLGIFDTVASVGAAGLFSVLEGRQSWAWNNMQVPAAVEQCLHLVAAHEVRACFPLDSVRVDGVYRSNVKEYVYPGSHSDIGGGYMPLCLGKNDWGQEDRQLARIPGYEMYCAALKAGVPFHTENRLAERRESDVAAALAPHEETVKSFHAYYKAAGIKPGPVEEMHRQHMRAYFKHRWQLSENGLQSSPEWTRASAVPKPNQGENYDGELDWMRATQRALIQVVAAVMGEIDRRMSSSEWINDNRLEQPLAFGLRVQLLSLLAIAGELPRLARRRQAVLMDGDIQAQAAALARKAPEYLAKWRKWLADQNQAEVHDTDIEREPLLLLEALTAEPLSSEISSFFFDFVHDSAAGFIGFGMPEFQLNGFGIAKFRRVYTGDNGDDFMRDIVAKGNEARIATAKAKRAQRAKWDLESREHQRANPRPW